VSTRTTYASPILRLGIAFRRFSLPDTADSQSVKARHSNGVLEVIIPKQPQVMPRRISVESN
jgi:HSP20 family protein